MACVGYSRAQLKTLLNFGEQTEPVFPFGDSRTNKRSNTDKCSMLQKPYLENSQKCSVFLSFFFA